MGRLRVLSVAVLGCLLLGTPALAREPLTTRRIFPVAGAMGRAFLPGAPASRSRLTATAMAALPGGGFVLLDVGHDQILRVGPGGRLTVLAGTGKRGFSGDGGPGAKATLRLARLSRFDFPDQASIAALSDGSVVFADTGNNRIRRVDAAGRITTLGGTGVAGVGGIGGPAVAARLDQPLGVAALSDGGVAISSERRGPTIYAIGADGTIRRVAGRSICEEDSGSYDALALEERDPVGVVGLPDGSALVAESRCVRRLLPDGTYETVVRQEPADDSIARIAAGEGTLLIVEDTASYQGSAWRIGPDGRRTMVFGCSSTAAGCASADKADGRPGTQVQGPVSDAEVLPGGGAAFLVEDGSSGRSRVLVLDDGGRVHLSSVLGITSLAVAPDGHLYALQSCSWTGDPCPVPPVSAGDPSPSSERVVRFEGDGVVPVGGGGLTAVGTEPVPAGDALLRAADLVGGADGSLLVLTSDLQVLRVAGGTVGRVGEVPQAPVSFADYHLAVLADGRAVVAGARRLVVVGLDGALSGLDVHPVFSNPLRQSPRRIAGGPGGSVWWTARTDHGGVVVRSTRGLSTRALMAKNDYRSDLPMPLLVRPDGSFLFSYAYRLFRGTADGRVRTAAPDAPVGFFGSADGQYLGQAGIPWVMDLAQGRGDDLFLLTGDGRVLLLPGRSTHTPAIAIGPDALRSALARRIAVRVTLAGRVRVRLFRGAREVARSGWTAVRAGPLQQVELPAGAPDGVVRAEAELRTPSGADVTDEQRLIVGARLPGSVAQHLARVSAGAARAHRSDDEPFYDAALGGCRRLSPMRVDCVIAYEEGTSYGGVESSGCFVVATVLGSDGIPRLRRYDVPCPQQPADTQYRLHPRWSDRWTEAPPLASPQLLY